MQERSLLLKLDGHFSPADSISRSNIMLINNSMRYVPQKNCKRMTRSSGVMEEIECIEHETSNGWYTWPRKPPSLMKSAHQVGKNDKKGTTDIEPSTKATMENTTQKAAGSHKVLEIPVVKKARLHQKKAKSVVHSGFDDEVSHRSPAGFTEPSKVIDEVTLL